MSNIEKFEASRDIVLSSEFDFNKLADIHGAVSWEREATFAIQALKANDYLCGLAYSNPDSLKMAIVNVAAIGLTLNPVRALAYLVPRDGKVMLDVSYRGYIQLALDSGAIEWAKSEIVYQSDEFIYNGLGKEPTHRFNPFSERGEIVGAYCAVKAKTGDYLVEMMPIKDIYSIRDRSKSWIGYKKTGKACPWVSDEGEMIRKTVIRRAYKSWPIPSEASKRLDSAMAETFEDHEIEVSPMTDSKVVLLDGIMNKLEMLGRDSKSDKFIEYLSRVFSRKVGSVEELTEYEMRKLTTILEQMVVSKKVEPVVETVEPALELEVIEPEIELETERKEEDNEESE